VLFCFVVTFPCLAASYFYAANGMLDLSNTTRVVGGAFAFIASMIVWYLWFSMILESVDFPVTLPVGDLSKFIKGASEIKKEKSRREMA
jgi:succinate-acetate transporter protein